MRKYLVAHHVLFEIITPMNILVTLVWWSVLRKETIEDYRHSPVELVHAFAIHSVPILANWITFSVTDIVFKASHCLVLAPIGVIYSYFNYCTVMRTGEPVYWFLDWKDSTSSIVVTVMTLSCMLFFLFMSWFSKKVRSFRPKAIKTGDSKIKKAN